MKFKPHPYQRRAIKWVIDHRRCCLFLDMGLGKSVITLTAINDLIDGCEIERALVVAPKKVAESTWSNEAQKWDHLKCLQVARVMGTEKQRVAALETEADVYVIGRDSFVWLMGYYNGQLPFDAIIIDELTSFKSSTSLRFKAMRIATAGMSRMIGLTGTPAPNGFVDLWAQLYCIDRGERLGKSITRYKDTYFNLHRWNNIVVRCTLKTGAEQTIRDKIADICLTMEARDYLELPPLLVEDRRIPMPPKVAEAYKEFEREKVLEVINGGDNDNETITAASAAGLMNKLSQFANGAIYDENGEWHQVHDEKVQHLAEIVENAGGSVLVFYQYKHDIERIKASLKQVRVRVYKDTTDLDDWNAGNVDVLLAHPSSTAYGLNMQQGGHIIVWFGTGWNLELYQQANARLHRQGQEHPVTVVRLIMENTVDERAVAAIDNKKNVQQALIDGLKALMKKY